MDHQGQDRPSMYLLIVMVLSYLYSITTGADAGILKGGGRASYCKISGCTVRAQEFYINKIEIWQKLVEHTPPNHRLHPQPPPAHTHTNPQLCAYSVYSLEKLSKMEPKVTTLLIQSCDKIIPKLSKDWPTIRKNNVWSITKLFSFQ